MTKIQKQRIEVLRRQGAAYSQIADTLGLSMNTVKSFCRRNNLVVLNASNDAKNDYDKDHCKHCGKKLKQIPKVKPKTFCCDKCRFDWWNKHKPGRISVHKLTCTYCGAEFGCHDKKRKYCRHACYINHRFKEGDRHDQGAV